MSGYISTLTTAGPDVLLDVWVVAGAGRTEIVGLHGHALKVRVASPPERGRANDALVELLGSVFDKQVELTAGRRGRSKTVRIRATDRESVETVLLALLGP